MRAVIAGLAGLVFVNDALAADYLRGSTYEGPRYNWAGVYIGGHIGYVNGDFDFSASTQPMVAEELRALLVEQEARISELPNLGKADGRGTGYGGFIGYNTQWGDAVLGLELNYTRTSVSASASDSIGRWFVLSNEFRNDVELVSNASATLTDYASLRARFGYAAGWLMPYGMVGVAAGRLNYARSVSIQVVETDVSATALDPTDGIPPRPGGIIDTVKTDQKTGAIAFGYMAGLGLDIGLFPGVFLRGEWEFVQLNPVGRIPLHINTFRAAAALKF